MFLGMKKGSLNEWMAVSPPLSCASGPSSGSVGLLWEAEQSRNHNTSFGRRHSSAPHWANAATSLCPHVLPREVGLRPATSLAVVQAP